MGRAFGKLAVAPVVALIRLYRLVLSPLLPNACRFYPSCSRYAQEALQIHGLVKGSILTVSRLCRCHPFNPGGCDPVPAVKARLMTGDSGS